MKKLILLLLPLLTSIRFYAQAPPICFNVANSYTIGANPEDIVTADFNSDGKIDIAVTNGGTNSISVLLGLGTGNFLLPVNYVVGTNPKGIVKGDFNNDGNVDLAVANFNSNNISVLKGTATGTFIAAVNYTTAINPLKITTGDFNFDGNLDLAYTEYGLNRTSIRMGSPTGTFAPAFSYAVGNSPANITTSDLNNDGKLDLVINHFVSTFVSVLLNTGTGTFNAAVNYSTAFNNGSTIICSDFDGDSKVDILSGSTGRFHFFKGTGIGTFSTVITSIAANQPYSMVSKDFNGDGIADLVAGCGCSNIETYTISPSAIINSVGSYSTSSGDYSGVATDDFNNDGKFDIAVASYGTNQLIIFLNGLPNVLATASASNICKGNSSLITASGANTYIWNTGSTTSTIAVSPTITTTYTLTGNGLNGCANTVTTTVIVNTPIVSVNSGSICSGSSFTILPSGASTYTYSSGSAVVSPLANTSYTVIGSSVTGCTNSAVSNVIVISTVTPSISISTPNTIICGSSATFSSVISNGGASPLYQWKKNSISVGSGISSYSPTSLNNGDVIYCILTSNALCSSPSVVNSNSITITVNPTPTISVNSGTICLGNSFIITPTGASTYTISGGSSIVSPSANNIYSVTGTSSIGCLGSNTAICSVSVNPNPTITIASSNTLICAGQTTSLTATGAISYTWNTSATSNIIVVTPTTTTAYTVTGTNSNSCSNVAIITQSVSTCTGLDSKIENQISRFVIYPNPSNGIFSIELNEVSMVTITNNFGQVIYNEKLNAGKGFIDIQNNVKGLYFVTISSNNYKLVTKLIVN
jgi:hypothetical protein